MATACCWNAGNAAVVCTSTAAAVAAAVRPGWQQQPAAHGEGLCHVRSMQVNAAMFKRCGSLYPCALPIGPQDRRPVGKECVPDG